MDSDGAIGGLNGENTGVVELTTVVQSTRSMVRGAPDTHWRLAPFGPALGHGAGLHREKGCGLVEKGLRPIIWSESGFLTIFNAF